MEIGGIDTILSASADTPIGDVIVDACQRLWKHESPVLQDTDSVAFYSLSDPRARYAAAASAEFFVYENIKAGESWMEAGLTRDNANKMLHFLIDRPEGLSSDQVEVTVVCDKLTPPMRRLIRELKTGFLEASRKPTRS